MSYENPQTDRQTDRFLTRRFWLAAVVFVFTASSLSGCNFDSNSSLRSNSVASKDSIAKKPNQKTAEAFQLTGPSVPPVPFGHEVGCSSTDYDIWSKNCHTAANEFCLDSNRKMPSAACGIVKCAANFDNESIQGHTFNWRIEGNQTCFYNWGNKECVDGTTVPPDMSRDDITYLVLEMCGPGQAVVERPEALKPGEMVENPSPSACLDEQIDLRPSVGPDENGMITDPDFRAACYQCCVTRADTWPCNKDDSKCADKFKFLKECKSNCTYPLRIGEGYRTPQENLAIRRGSICWQEDTSDIPIPNPSHCKKCCTEAAGRNDFSENSKNTKLIKVCERACLEHTPDPTDL